MQTTLLHPEMLGAIATGVTRVTAMITDPGTPAVTASGGTSISGPTSTNVQGWVATASYQSLVRVFGEQVAARVQAILIAPAGTVAHEGWTVTADDHTYTVVTVARSVTAQAPVWVALAERKPIGG